MNVENPSELRDYLSHRGYSMTASRVLPGGVSSNTVLVDLADGSQIVVKQSRAMLKSASEWRSDPRRITQEALAMEWLPRWTPPHSIPRLVFFDEPARTLAMEAIGQHAEWKQQLLGGIIEEPSFRKFGELLAAIHSGSYRDRSLVEPIFREQSHFFALRLEAYYLFTAERVPEAAELLRRLVHDCQHHRYALVHGDYSPKNILIQGNRMVLLDHEAANFGDPTFDIGFAMALFLSKALHLPERRQQMRAGAQTFWRSYETGLPQSPEFADVSAQCVRQTLGCTLARVAGKSLAEYLTPEERQRQRENVLHFIANPPRTMEELIDKYVDRLD